MLIHDQWQDHHLNYNIHNGRLWPVHCEQRGCFLSILNHIETSVSTGILPMEIGLISVPPILLASTKYYVH